MKLTEKIKQLKETKPIETGTLILTDNFYLSANAANQTLLNDQPLPIQEFHTIIITPYAKGSYHDKFLNEIAKQGTQLIKLDYWGNPIWGLYPKERTIATLTKAQLLLTTKPYDEVRKKLIVDLMTAKAKSQSLVQGTIRTPTVNDMDKWLKDMMMSEGEYANKYWDIWRKEHDLVSYMNKRATSSTRSTTKTNRNATDMVNVLLNLGYGILAHKITFELYQNGLDPTMGFYHIFEAHGRRYSLTWDIIEPYRTLIDGIVADNLNNIDDEDFIWDIEHNNRFLMLKDEPHAIGKLSESAYKDWIKKFTSKLPKNKLAENTIILYKKALQTVLQKEGTPKEETTRSIRNVTTRIKKLKEAEPLPEAEKPTEEPTHKPDIMEIKK